MADNNSGKNGIGFFGLLILMLIGLKLTGYITWSWWWILLPFWIAPALIVGFVGVVLVCLILAGIGFGLYKLGELALGPALKRRRIVQKQKAEKARASQRSQTNVRFEPFEVVEDKPIDAEFKIIEKDRR